MTTFFFRSLVGCLIAFAFVAHSEAKAGIIITWGETISPIGVSRPQDNPTHQRVYVGFKYKYSGVFWLDLWTSDGTYCIYEGKKYYPIPAAEAARLISIPESELTKPFLYQVPLGWLVLGVPIAGFIALFARACALDRKAIRKRHANELTQGHTNLSQTPTQVGSEELDNLENVQQIIKRWQEDACSTGILDKDALAKLPPDEQAVLKKLSAFVEEGLRKAPENTN
jgi:hypothetical protein